MNKKAKNKLKQIEKHVQARTLAGPEWGQSINHAAAQPASATL